MPILRCSMYFPFHYKKYTRVVRSAHDEEEEGMSTQGNTVELEGLVYTGIGSAIG